MDEVAQLRGSPRRTHRRAPIGCTQPPTVSSKLVVRNPPPAVLAIFLAFVMFDGQSPTNVCVFTANGRRRASLPAHSTKHRALWTVRAAKSRLVQVESM
jgi:hypothetical protein